jgi:hypothetical protein
MPGIGGGHYVAARVRVQGRHMRVDHGGGVGHHFHNQCEEMFIVDVEMGARRWWPGRSMASEISL